MWPALVAVGAAVALSGCEKKAPAPKKAAPVQKKAEVPVKLDITATVAANDVTSKSAVIHYEVPNIDIDKIGPKRAFLLIIKITGYDAEGRYLELPSMRTVLSRRDLVSNDEVLLDNYRDKNGKISLLLPGATYNVTLAYDVIPRTMDIGNYNNSGTVIATCTFKTLPQSLAPTP